MSGSFLLFAGRRLKNNYRSFFFWCSLATATLGLLCLLIALQLPIDSQFLFQTPGQVLLFVLYNVMIPIPFFLGATAIGLALIYHTQKSSTIYGISMLGTGCGGIFAIMMMFLFPEQQLLQVALLPTLCASALWIEKERPLQTWTFVAGTAVLILLLMSPPRFFLEPYKGLAQLQRWADQDQAKLILTRHSPRGRIDVFESPLLHFTLFAGIHAVSAPPPEFAILRDGYFGGTVFRISSAEQATILDQTPTSLAYRLRPGAKTLLLGETGGTNVWLARRFAANHITVVQPDPTITGLLQGPLAKQAGYVFSQKDTTVVEKEPRLFVQSTPEKFDVIQIVSAEEMAAESRGATGLQEDYLLTVEGLGATWDRLSTRGILSISRETQTPPRDSLKFVAALNTALLQRGVSHPSQKIVVLQNYLADTILVFRSTPESIDLEKIRSISSLLALDIRWDGHPIPGFAVPVDGLPSLAGAVSSILTNNGNLFIKNWMYDIRPPTDARPFFRDFFRIRAISWLREVYLDNWYQNVELGFAILLLVTAVTAILSFLFLIVPIVIYWRFGTAKAERTASRLGFGLTSLYFWAIGIGFMGFEIIAISRISLYLGDPLYSATTAITCLLVGAGAGSIFAGRNLDRSRGIIRRASLGVLVYGALLYVSTFADISTLSQWPLPARILITGVSLLPLAFLLGFYFPSGLHMARKSSEILAPWAWAVNGFASVVAPSLLTMIAMAVDQRFVILVSLISYVLAALTAESLARLKPQAM